MTTATPLADKLLSHPPVLLEEVQDEVGVWWRHNFGDTPDELAVIGLGEEVGEVLRGFLKRAQGIRGTREEWTAEIRKEYGDVLIKCIEGIDREGWDVIDVLTERWESIRTRDFKADAVGHGIEKA